MNTHVAPERCFAAVVALRAAPPQFGHEAPLDLAGIVRTWPRALAVRLLAGMPTDCIVTGLLALPNRFETARVGQLFRTAAMDGAIDTAVDKALRALAEINFARAATLRRDMEWEAQDAVFFPTNLVLPRDELPLHLAVLADALWDDLPLPCIHRLPAPKDYPDTWPDSPLAVATLQLPESISIDPAQQLRVGIEWLHLWRLDSSLADAVWQSVPVVQSAGWIDALQQATRPDSSEALPYDLVVFEHVMDERNDFLSQIEVAALLRCVCDQPDEDGSQIYSEDARGLIQKAVQVWLARAGREYSRSIAARSDS
jgi:hypothetical protein